MNADPKSMSPGLPGDPDWGGAFWKTNAYAPWPVWIWLNGYTWALDQFINDALTAA